MSKIKVGNKLICIENKLNDEKLYFTIGELYEITLISMGAVHLKNDYSFNNYFLTSEYSCAANLWDFFEVPTLRYYRKEKLKKLNEKM